MIDYNIFKSDLCMNLWVEGMIHRWSSNNFHHLFWSDNMGNNLVRSINILSIHHGPFEAKLYVKYCSNKL